MTGPPAAVYLVDSQVQFALTLPSRISFIQPQENAHAQHRPSRY